jgi:hypothetical protein
MTMINAKGHLTGGGNNATWAGKEIVIWTPATGHTAF